MCCLSESKNTKIKGVVIQEGKRHRRGNTINISVMSSGSLHGGMSCRERERRIIQYANLLVPVLVTVTDSLAFVPAWPVHPVLDWLPPVLP